MNVATLDEFSSEMPSAESAEGGGEGELVGGITSEMEAHPNDASWE